MSARAAHVYGVHLQSKLFFHMRITMYSIQHVARCTDRGPDDFSEGLLMSCCRAFDEVVRVVSSSHVTERVDCPNFKCIVIERSSPSSSAI